ncbi:hypothetical protein HanRHA438_Chr11g0491931 [Helianthus annuus]|nr:hypothetical protein HanIR_Chr11g0515771 [Helianthus annuus]KAJ0869697.1 hypothetical protein HanRHA438_Chr11g0491931 [Helianthus annuus]
MVSEFINTRGMELKEILTDVFPEDLLGLSPDREEKLRIHLRLGTTPIVISQS